LIIELTSHYNCPIWNEDLKAGYYCPWIPALCSTCMYEWLLGKLPENIWEERKKNDNREPDCEETQSDNLRNDGLQVQQTDELQPSEARTDII